nr:type VI secretion system membrane subunit TssM [uncultured Cupriavidus sp.]
MTDIPAQKREDDAAAMQIVRDDGAQITQAVLGALDRLKCMRKSRGIRGLLDRINYRYALPWYLVMGATGAGKTTALFNAGVAFPIAAQMADAARMPDATANVHCWMTDDAVLVDTAGRYTEQDTLRDSEEEQTATGSRAEWSTLLAQLRKHRPRAPVNGAILAISCTDLLALPPEALRVQAASLRKRLLELRQELGVQFPVYVLVTKLDRIAGFVEHFQFLSSEGRAQPWGFTLPLGEQRCTRGSVLPALAQQCRAEMTLLFARLRDGWHVRQHEMSDPIGRKRMQGFCDDLQCMVVPLLDMLEQVFLDSRYDNTESQPMFRGVYFTSAIQSGPSVMGDPHTVMQILARTAASTSPQGDMAHGGDDENLAGTSKAATHRGYFMRDVFRRIIVPEAGLVRPNLYRALQFRLVRIIAHCACLALFAWVAYGLRVSFDHNRAYLDDVTRKSREVAECITAFHAGQRPGAAPELLAMAENLPKIPGNGLQTRGLDWRFGLYVVPRIADATAITHRSLQDGILVPYLVQRVEAALSAAVETRDRRRTYDALRVYLMLHDAKRFDVADVRDWMRNDWATGNAAADFGGRITAFDTFDSLLDGRRVLRSLSARNDTLVQASRAFLDGSSSVERLYDRARDAMLDDAPPDFTLARAVGPQAGAVLTRASGASVEQGVPGLFTHDGYHRLFNKRLAEFVDHAQAMDAWVMGRAPVGTIDQKTGDDRLHREVRGLYLAEYVRHWESFLADIRVVSGDSLAFDLEVLRQLAAADSPLLRLGRAVMHETTLGQGVDAQDAGGQERELVDKHFAALREVVLGRAEVTSANAPGVPGSPRLDAMASMLNAYYTTLVVANNVLNTRNLPPAADAGNQLRMEAARLPAPFKAVLSDLVAQGTRGVNQGIGQVLVAKLDAAVGEQCRSAIDGKYPFTPTSAQDVDAADFLRIFAAGGLLDEFFQQVLAPHVDTTISPWRYRLTAPDVPPVTGPSLVPFQRARAIREAFFREPAAKQLALTLELKVADVDPEIVSLQIDIDGQAQRYVHGPVAPLRIAWPGPDGGQRAELTAYPRVRPETSTISVNGPWALMRLFDRARIASSATAGRLQAEFDFDGRKASFDVHVGSLPNPWTSDLLRGFRCPDRLGRVDPAN